MKPGAGRLQMDIPLRPGGPNVNPEAEQSMQLKHLRLVSQPAALPTSFAIGVCHKCLRATNLSEARLKL